MIAAAFLHASSAVMSTNRPITARHALEDKKPACFAEQGARQARVQPRP